MNVLEMLMSSEDDTRTKIEVFFTQNGIYKLQETNSEQGTQAFLKANSFTAQAQHQPQANDALEAYYKISNNWLSWLTNSSQKDMAHEYEEKFGRNFRN